MGHKKKTTNVKEASANLTDALDKVPEMTEKKKKFIWSFNYHFLESTFIIILQQEYSGRLRKESWISSLKLSISYYKDSKLPKKS